MSIVTRSEPPPSSSSNSGAAAALTYVHWMPRDEPAMAAAVIAVIGAVVALTAANAASAWLSLAVLLSLSAIGWTALVPIRYTFTAAGIERRLLYWRPVIQWAAIGRCEETPRGLRIFRTPQPGPLDALASAFIPFAGHAKGVKDEFRRRALRCTIDFAQEEQ